MILYNAGKATNHSRSSKLSQSITLRLKSRFSPHCSCRGSRFNSSPHMAVHNHLKPQFQDALILLNIQIRGQWWAGFLIPHSFILLGGKKSSYGIWNSLIMLGRLAISFRVYLPSAGRYRQTPCQLYMGSENLNSGFYAHTTGTFKTVFSPAYC